jgi:hypothetical protein
MQIYLRNRTAGSTELISANLEGVAGNGPSTSARMSTDGRFVIFKSEASNLLTEAPQGGVFLLDRQNHTLTLVDTDGNAPCVSDTAEVVAYDKLDTATGKNQIFVRFVDHCPSDPRKDIPGACGCNKADTDSDLDGTPDCVDTCPSDSLKGTPGKCGCGVPDTDLNHNSTADCREKWFRPTTPLVTVQNHTAQITMKRGSRMRWEVSLKLGRRTTAKEFRTYRATYKNLRPGRYIVSYRLADISTGYYIWGYASTKVSFRVR